MRTLPQEVAAPRRRCLLGIGTVLSLGVALMASGGRAQAADAPRPAAASPAPALGGAASGGAVIVVLKSEHSSLNLRTQGNQRMAAAYSDQAPVVADIKSHGGTDVTQLVAVNAVAAHVSAAEVSRLRNDPSVAEVIPDSTVRVAPSPPTTPLTTNVAPAKPRLTCPFDPAAPSKPVQEPEAMKDIHASTGHRHATDMANSIATGKSVIVANEGMNQLAGNPNFQRPDGAHVVIDAPNYRANHSNDEFYGDASSIATQGTVVYQYSKALPYSGLPRAARSSSRATRRAPRSSICR